MRRAVIAFLSVALAGVALLASPSARGDDASVPTPRPDQSVCVGQTAGSPCRSSTMAAGGTCIPGCCGLLVNGPEEPPVYSACLACSDTSGSDPTFSSLACPDGGGTVIEQDAGIAAIFDDAGPTTGSNAPSSSSGGCSSAAPAEGPSPSSAGLLLGLVLIAAVRRKRTDRST